MLLTQTLALAAATLSAPTDGGTFAVQAEHVHTGSATIENGVVLIENGKVKAVGADVIVPDGAPTIELEGHLTAGLVALHDYSGAAPENRDTTRTVMDTADLAHAYRGEHHDFDRLVEEGVTSVLLAPARGSLCGGLAAVVKPGSNKVVARGTHLHVSFSSAMFNFGRAPTSYGGALAMLEGLMAEPQGGFAKLKAGETRALLDASTRAEAQRAIAFAKRHGLRGSIYGVGRISELADELKDAELGVVLQPFSLGATPRVRRGAAELAEAGVKFGFALDNPGRHTVSLRAAAAAAMREGLAADVAWAALTSTAAELAGVSDRLGTIAPGRDADLVLWSGPPTDLTSSVQAVWIDGEKVHDGGDDE